MPSKLSQFWRELKRRNVVRVVTVYAGAAFVVLELVDMITEPFGLPAWAFKLTILLLSVGLIIAIILSWMYDFYHDRGIVKTEPAPLEDSELPVRPFNGWKIASYISFVVIVVLGLLHVLPIGNRNKLSEIPDKSIAVLPFISLSEDPDKQYQADGVMDAILLHLSKIEDLRVLSRTSVEQYRQSEKTALQICEELDVAYLLEGSFQKYGDQARLIVQLIRAGKEEHVWAENYDREWKDIFSVQSEVAEHIARELKAVITPAEKQRIEKVPTDSPIAYDLYIRGKDELTKFRNEMWFMDDLQEPENAEEFFTRALAHDSSFAEVYAGLAWAYMLKASHTEYLSEDYMDSVFILANKAISLDPSLSDAYTLRGMYFQWNGQVEKAVKDFNLALEFNPNSWLAYERLGLYYQYTDLVKSLEYLGKAVNLNRGEGLLLTLAIMARTYGWSLDFIEYSANYYHQVLELGGDTCGYYLSLADTYIANGLYEQAILNIEKGLAINERSETARWLMGWCYMMVNQPELSYKFFSPFIQNLEASGDYDLRDMHRYGYVLWTNGYFERANKFFDKQVELCEYSITMERPYAQDFGAYFDLAAIFAFRGEKAKAIENLKTFKHNIPIALQGYVTLAHDDPLFDPIREEPEFNQILQDLEAKYQAEHERVRQWLEENKKGPGN